MSGKLAFYFLPFLPFAFFALCLLLFALYFFCPLPLAFRFHPPFTPMFYRFILICCVACCCSATITAQTDAPLYKGQRITLFDIKILQQNKKSIVLLCQGANTGRLPIHLDGKHLANSAALLIELDSFSLPVVLQGREHLLTKAFRRQKLRIAPGEVREQIRLTIPLRKPEIEAPSVEGNGSKLCPDLVFDTAYVAKYTDKTMVLHFAIRNIGTTPAHLLGKSARSVEDNVAVNVYFVSGTKLSRGSIYADGMFIREGKETLDGILQPGQVLHGALEISLKNRTRFSPNLAFELDPFQRTDECDRTNNIRTVVVEF